jgi:hypothetical protein
MVLSDFDFDDALSESRAHARLPIPHTIPLLVETEVHEHMHEVVLPPVPQGPEPEGLP